MIWGTADILGKVNLVEIIVNKTTDFVIAGDCNVTKSVLALLSRRGFVKSTEQCQCSKYVQLHVLD